MPRVSRPPKKSSSASRKHLASALVVMVCAASGLFWLWQRGPERQQNLQKITSLAGGPFRLEDEKKVYAQYAGSASCRECHEEAFTVWKNSHHGLAEREPAASMDAAAFEPARSFHHGTQQTSI